MTQPYTNVPHALLADSQILPTFSTHLNFALITGHFSASRSTYDTGQFQYIDHALTSVLKIPSCWPMSFGADRSITSSLNCSKRFSGQLVLSHLTAYRVSSSWRDMAEFVIRTTTKASTWSAKRLTQTVSDNLQIFRAHQEDLMEVGDAILLRERRRRGETTPQVLTTFGQPGPPNQPVTHAPTWLDFTQFDLNPYLTGLFADEDRISVVKGRIDVVRRREPGIARVYDCNKLPTLTALKALTGPMFFTNPPCKQISIGVWSGGVEGWYYGHFLELASYNLSSGVTNNEILRLLEDNADFTVDYWDHEARLHLLSNSESMNWKHDIWNARGLPVLSIVLRNEDSLHRDHWLQNHNMEPRTLRQGEWMSRDMMKPPKPSPAEVDQLFPRMYGIGFHEPIFKDKWKTR
ncbi:hypothetical protein CC86DRAFT_459277 [Ophiobolus disseminans]|uniref:Uncharacterized protein n=1 Tax=Ophiobolus disseminans TaxID=1469910 RepID=A0A6A6ZLK5_9PLEO|nr:hypothetical protein CC86DRAFT_459277 [Ophiobolus disseminans]